MFEYLLFAPLAALVFLIPLFFDLRRARRRHARQDALRVQAAAALEGLQVARVHLARPEWFDESRAVAATGEGWIGFDAQRIRIVGVLGDGTSVERDIPRDKAAQAWAGRIGNSGDHLYWFSLGEPALRLAADTALGWHSLQATSALYRQIFAGSRPPSRREKFHLQSQPLSLVATLLLIALMLYAGYDYLIERVALVGDHRWVTFTALALIPAGLLLLPLFRRSRLPPREVLLMPLLLGFAAGLATIPLLKRIDRSSGDGLFTDTPYFHDGACVFKPVQSGTPDLRVINADEFCAQLQPGAEQSFYLRRGGLGLWQVDYDGLRRQVLGFYQGKGKSVPRIAVR